MKQIAFRNLEKKLGDVMEELAVMRGEQSKWQRKY